MKWLFLALGLSLPGSAFAGSAYDWQSGNQYYWNEDSLGNTHVRGFNYNTGSQWNTNIKQNGDMNGTDSRGNLWNYNDNSGSYMNSDGTFCIGKGALRTCN
jgi:hypothetical protein